METFSKIDLCALWNSIWEILGGDGWAGISAIATAFAAITALALSYKANRISRKQYLFSTKPIIECYLETFKTEGRIPFIVLVVENYGSLPARDIKMTIDYPEGISDSIFGEDALRLGRTPFTLAPHTRLCTPICWNRDKEVLGSSKIKIEGTFSY